jgi:hypothetical protein
MQFLVYNTSLFKEWKLKDSINNSNNNNSKLWWEIVEGSKNRFPEPIENMILTIIELLSIRTEPKDENNYIWSRGSPLNPKFNCSQSYRDIIQLGYSGYAVTWLQHAKLKSQKRGYTINRWKIE